MSDEQRKKYETTIARQSDQLDELSYLRAERDELKKALGGGMYSEQKKVIAVLDNEITLLRAENERLKEDHFKSLVFISDQGLILGDLRKRCEDLEADTIKFGEWLTNSPENTIRVLWNEFKSIDARSE